MNTYPTVMATEYLLKTKTAITKNVNGQEVSVQVWDVNCPARVNKGTKQQMVDYIEEMNRVDNNVHFVVDEEATKELQEIIKKARIVKAEKLAMDTMSTADVLRQALAIKDNSVPATKAPKSVVEVITVEDEDVTSDFSNMSELELKQYCTDNGISYHHKAGKAKLLELINQ